MKIGLVLEGGAMRGLYTAGVLDVFMDNNIKIDGIVGVSAGALFGINYCSKQKGRVLRYNKKYINDPRYMSFKSLIKTGNIIGEQFAYHDIPFKLDPFDEDTFKKSGIDFYLTMTNVNTGKPEYTKIVDTYKQIDYFKATSAMPFVSKIVNIDGKQYLDGGISDSIPIDKCEELGYDKIIVVLTRPLEYRKKKNNKLLVKLKYGKYPNFVNTINNRYINYNNTVEKIIDKENKKEIFVIRPSKTIDISRLEKDPNKLQEMYDLGVNDCKNSLDKLKEYINFDK